MADDTPKRFTTELTKNANKGAWYEIIGGLTGAGIGSLMSASRNLKGWQFFSKTMDFAFFGWMIGLVSRLWTERTDNQNSALKLDSRMIDLEHENKWLKQTVVELGGELPEHNENHAEKITSGREASGDCGCPAKH